MTTHPSDVTIHINQTLDAQARQALVDGILQREGVVSATVNEEHPHLMICRFDPARVDTADLIAAVKAAGYEAQLVGL